MTKKLFVCHLINRQKLVIKLQGAYFNGKM